MLKLFNYITIFYFISLGAAHAMSIKDSPIAQSREHYDKKDLDIKIESFTELDIKAIVDNSSFEWVRVDDTLLAPRVRLKIRINHVNPRFHILYKASTTSFQQSANNSYSEIYYSLFEHESVTILKGSKEIGKVSIQFKKHKKKKIIIDYTCSRNNIQVKGLTDEHFSLGCHSRRIGTFGKEKQMLEIQWISPELKIIGSDFLPYQAAFLNKRSIKINVLNTRTQIEKQITITAKISKRLHRLFTAYGFGPYQFNTSITDKNGDLLNEKSQVSPALFFYLNYKISETSSIRGFDAAIFQESKFNNAAIYLGSDFGFSLDNKLYFTTLLGVQYLYFKFDDLSAEVSEAIFPQGLEFMYRHAFDIPNYIISGGLFLSTTESIEYENIWIRWGKSYFWELNLIKWGKDDFRAETWGLSIGLPFKGFL